MCGPQNKWTNLHYAAAGGSRKQVCALIEAKAVIEAKTHHPEDEVKTLLLGLFPTTVYVRNSEQNPKGGGRRSFRELF